MPTGTEVVAGEEGLASIATVADVAVNGVVGFAGLTVTLAALAAGRRLALANKESIIAGAPWSNGRGAPREPSSIPVDSEHCALHQCLRAGRRSDVARLLLTASGGPFRGRTRDELATVGVAEALTHPTWSMGPKITVDSSTLMNKGLEVIEAHELFGVPYDAIDVLVHPQSIVHSIVEFTDGASMAQLSQPDMRLPIGYALAYPDRLPVAFGPVDWAGLSTLDFEPPDRDLFPCLDIAYRAGRAGDLAPAWLNAANEVAVAAFLAGRIRWTAIAEVVAAVLDPLPRPHRPRADRRRGRLGTRASTTSSRPTLPPAGRPKRLITAAGGAGVSDRRPRPRHRAAAVPSKPPAPVLRRPSPPGAWRRARRCWP